MTFKLKSRSRSRNALADFRAPANCRRVGFDSKKNAVDFYIPATVLEQLFRHALNHSNTEVGGYLFGHSYENEQQAAVLVTGAYSITSKSATAVHFRFEIEDSVKAEAYQQERFAGSEIVGWYHTHPGHGIFMSGVDEATHVEYFKLFHRVAMVIDPRRKEFAAFVHQHGDVYSLGSILVVEEASERVFPEMAVMLAQPPRTVSAPVSSEREPERPVHAPVPAKEPAAVNDETDADARLVSLEHWRSHLRFRWLLRLAIALLILVGGLGTVLLLANFL